MSQKATAKSNSSVVQASGDVHIGMGMVEVERLFQLLLIENMPTLQKVAAEKAQENTNALVERVRKEFEERFSSINLTRLTEPDVQSTINDAVQGAAKKGEKIDLSTLASLILDRLNDEGDDFLDNSLEEAIRILPKLSKDLLYSLAINHFIKNLQLENASAESLESIFTLLRFEILIHCESITDTRLVTLGAIGAANYVNIGSGDSLREHIERYPILSGINIEAETPNLKYVLSKYDELGLQKITLTLPGILIANRLLEPFLGKTPMLY